MQYSPVSEQGEDHSLPFSIFSKHFHSTISLPFERQKWTHLPFRMLLWCDCNFWAAIRWWHDFQGSLKRSVLAGLPFPDLLERPGTLCDAWMVYLPLLRALRQTGGKRSEHHWKAWDLHHLFRAQISGDAAPAELLMVMQFLPHRRGEATGVGLRLCSSTIHCHWSSMVPIQRWSPSAALWHMLQGAEYPSSFPMTALGYFRLR